MKTIDMLINELRDAAYDSGWYAGKIEEMGKHGGTSPGFRELHAESIKMRNAATKALRDAVQK